MGRAGRPGASPGRCLNKARGLREGRQRRTALRACQAPLIPAALREQAFSRNLRGVGRASGRVWIGALANVSRGAEGLSNLHGVNQFRWRHRELLNGGITAFDGGERLCFVFVFRTSITASPSVAAK